MTCDTDTYKHLIDSVLIAPSVAVEWFAPFTGRPLAIVAVCLSVVPLAVLFAYATRVAVPRLFGWWFAEHVVQRAHDYYDRKCLGTGMTHRAATISIAMGCVFFLMVRQATLLPAHLHYTVPVLLAAFLVTALIGYAVAGKVPRNRVAWYKYLRRFQAPSVTGAALGLAAAGLDFVLKLGTAVATYIQTT